MPRISANTIELFYESFGSASAPTVLLIMGLGAQLTRWNIELCDLLVHRGYRVIRFDNRDSGLSTRCDGLALPDFSALLRGASPFALPYSLETMAADSIGLLDALEIEQAHLVGASMGGAIAQIIAARYPERTHSPTDQHHVVERQPDAATTHFCRRHVAVRPAARDSGSPKCCSGCHRAPPVGGQPGVSDGGGRPGVTVRPGV